MTTDDIFFNAGKGMRRYVPSWATVWIEQGLDGWTIMIRPAPSEPWAIYGLMPVNWFVA